MKFFHKIKSLIGEARLKKGSARTDRAFLNIDQAKTIAVIFDATNIDHLEIVKKYVGKLKERKKNIKAVGFFDMKITPQNISYSKAEFDFFNLKELTGINQPSSPYIQTFIKEPFDILVDLNIQNKFPLRSIMLQSAAKFKVGIDIPENQQTHDLLISVKPEEGLVHFLNQVERYLEMINKADN